eukprot:m.62740 g.62740  ORF g.62740 m.62740 type:complete len:303 (-) comp17714_c0_seq4:234-1142(-)
MARSRAMGVAMWPSSGSHTSVHTSGVSPAADTSDGAAITALAERCPSTAGPAPSSKQSVNRTSPWWKSTDTSARRFFARYASRRQATSAMRRIRTRRRLSSLCILTSRATIGSNSVSAAPFSSSIDGGESADPFPKIRERKLRGDLVGKTGTLLLLARPIGLARGDASTPNRNVWSRAPLAVTDSPRSSTVKWCPTASKNAYPRARHGNQRTRQPRVDTARTARGGMHPPKLRQRETETRGTVCHPRRPGPSLPCRPRHPVHQHTLRARVGIFGGRGLKCCGAARGSLCRCLGCWCANLEAR